MNRIERLLRSPLGTLVARPWFDTFVLVFFNHWFFPLSRLWAAARAAHGSTEQFFAAVPMKPSADLEPRLAKVLSEFEGRRAEAAAAEQAWEEGFFGDLPTPPEVLAELERRRLQGRAAYNAMRKRFAFLRRGRRIAPVRWDLLSPIDIAADYARAVRHPDELFNAPEILPAVQVSKAFDKDQGRHYWIRFGSPSEKMDDTVTARVLEPHGVDDPPTIIFLHGVCVEFDHWHGMIDDTAELCREGVRTIRVEAPWHGRRVAEDRYGGEKFIGTMPLGSLQYFSAQVREVAVLTDWCRRQSRAPVALGGSSLGAHVARLSATWANAWPARLQPDALLLITPCERLEDAAIHGAFARIWKTVENSAHVGWTAELRTKWFDLLDPAENPCVAPDNIVAVLGSRDRVTPFPSGRRLIGRLQLPQANIFIRRQGHFSTPINLIRDKAPLLRFCRILHALSGATGSSLTSTSPAHTG
jgi:hypothetical protein